jgi:hypothetical protein
MRNLLADEDQGQSGGRAHAFDAAVMMLAMTAGLFGGGSPDSPSTTTEVRPGHAATWTIEGDKPWANDGCSAAPDSGWWGDFHQACVHHDGCYRQHWSSKSTCDRWFLSDMKASCSDSYRFWDPRTIPCNAQAYAFFIGVTTFGGEAYNN